MDLLPCPFCGEKPYYQFRMDEDIWTHNIVQWTEVGCAECQTLFDHPTDAIEKGNPESDPVARWNTRI